MEKKAYLEAREVAERELLDLIADRQELSEQLDSLNQRIGKLRETVVSLSHLCGDVPKLLITRVPEEKPYLLPGAGLTNAVRNVLQSYPSEYLHAGTVRERLVRLGYDISKPANILAAIITILKRLVESGEAEHEEIDGFDCYKYKRKTLLKSKTPPIVVARPKK